MAGQMAKLLPRACKYKHRHAMCAEVNTFSNKWSHDYGCMISKQTILASLSICMLVPVSFHESCVLMVLGCNLCKATSPVSQLVS